jgi:hypothetical protein
VHYDNTVRNAAGVVVQFTYGDDGLDPVVMEAKEGRPLDLGRVLDKVGGGRKQGRVARRGGWEGGEGWKEGGKEGRDGPGGRSGAGGGMGGGGGGRTQRTPDMK